MKSPEPGNEAQRKVEKLLQKLSAEIITENYYRKLSAEIITENYQQKLLQKIMSRRNYYRKLSAEIITENYELVYYNAENVGIIGILAYPKISPNFF